MDPSVAVAWITVLGTFLTGLFSVVTALLARRQNRQQEECDVPALLVNPFPPRWEVGPLDNLYRRQPFPYDVKRFEKFPDEVRHLRDLELIEPHQSDFHVGELPKQGDLLKY